jgi:hypothetical protein
MLLQKLFRLPGVIIATLCAASAQAEVLNFTILDYPGHSAAPTVYETFKLDSTAGKQTILNTVFFAINEDSLGRTGAYFSHTLNNVGTGSLQTLGVLPIKFTTFLSSEIYSGSGLTLNAEPGDNFYSFGFNAARRGGYEILVTSGSVGSPVPEPSTWIMMLGGLAGLGFVGHRRKKLAFPS